MGNANYIKTLTKCEGCRHRSEVCVNVDREVPHPLECTPGRPLDTEPRQVARSPRLTCPDCGRTWAHTPDTLVEAVNQTIARGGWGAFIRGGGVEVLCRVA